MRILDIVPGTSVDGPGLRTAIYFAGCKHCCHGCHNPQSWDFTGGHEMTMEEVLKEVADNDFDVTLTGGDPMYHAEELVSLAVEIKKMGKDIWCYTGFMYEDIISDVHMSHLLEHIDVLVDGPYIESLRDIHLLFRGSSNQRLINVAKSASGHVVEWNWGD